MASKNLTWSETKKKFPSSATMLKSWLDDLFKIAKVDLNKFFGTDEPISSTGKQYIVAVHQSEFDKIKKVLSGTKAPALSKSSSKKYDVYWTPVKATTMAGAKAFLFLLLDTNTLKETVKIQLKTTGSKAHDPAAKKAAGKAAGGWGVFYKPSSGSWTPIQETISLRMFEHILGPGLSGVERVNEKSFGEQPPGNKYFKSKGFANKVIGKGARTKMMWEHIHHPDCYSKKPNADGSLNPVNSGTPAWLSHFQRQYEWIYKNTEFSNASFDVFSYTEFMKFIVGIVTKTNWPVFGKISQKDSWNPADVWLIDKGRGYESLIEACQKSGTILELNSALVNAYHDNIVVGISLKQSSSGGIKFEKVNLALAKSGHTSPSYTPFVTLGKFFFRIPYVTNAKGKGNFNLKTNDVSFRRVEGNITDPVGMMRCGSNASKPGNITMDMKGVGKQAAMFGKLPKNMGWSLIETAIAGIAGYGINGWAAYLKGIEDKTYLVPAQGKPLTTAKKKKYAENKKYWTERVSFILDNGIDLCSEPGVARKSLKSLVNDIKNLERNGDPDGGKEITSPTNCCLQFVELLYIFSVLKKVLGNKQAPSGPGEKGTSDINYFDWICGKFFYFSQKKGSAFGSNFGPFGKLY